MKLHIEICIDNAAFGGGFGLLDPARDECFRLLTEQLPNLGMYGNGDKIKLRDLNGNIVGFARFSDAPLSVPGT